MGTREIVAQAFGIVGMLIMVLSFQVKENKKMFAVQVISMTLFVINFFMIGAIAGALYNLVGGIRGLLLMKNAKKPWKLVTVQALFTACFLVSLGSIWGNYFQIGLSFLTYLGLVSMTYFMWKGNGKHIRICQVAITSPAWIIYNIFNFTLGGLLCEMFNMVSVVVSLIRYRKDGFEK